jgi:hypothetical protein
MHLGMLAGSRSQHHTSHEPAHILILCHHQWATGMPTTVQTELPQTMLRHHQQTNGMPTTVLIELPTKVFTKHNGQSDLTELLQ